MSKIIIEECIVHGKTVTDFRMWPVASYGECGNVVLNRGSFVSDSIMPKDKPLLCRGKGISMISPDVCVFEKRGGRWQFWALTRRVGSFELLREIIHRRVFHSHINANVEEGIANKAARDAVEDFDQLGDVKEPE